MLRIASITTGNITFIIVLPEVETMKVWQYPLLLMVRLRNGIYYFVYGSHSQHGESNCATLDYATSISPLGPYTYRGVIIDNWGSGRNLVNNHGCIVEINGQWYIAYHRPTHATATGTMRKACLEPITFNPDGTIPEVEMTTQGIGGLFIGWMQQELV